MTEPEVKQRLEELLLAHRPGHLLHVMAGIYEEVASDTEQAGDLAARDKAIVVSHALIVAACGFDAVLPK